MQNGKKSSLFVYLKDNLQLLTIGLKGLFMKNKGKITVISLLVVIIVVCGGYFLLRPSTTKDTATEKTVKTETVSSSTKKHHRHHAKKDDTTDESVTDDSTADEADSTTNTATTNENQSAQAGNNAQGATTNKQARAANQGQNNVNTKAKSNIPVKTNTKQAANNNRTQVATVTDGMNFSYRAAQKAGIIDNNTSVEEFYQNAKEGKNSVTYNGQTVYYKSNGNGQYQVTRK